MYIYVRRKAFISSQHHGQVLLLSQRPRPEDTGFCRYCGNTNADCEPFQAATYKKCSLSETYPNEAVGEVVLKVAPKGCLPGFPIEGSEGTGIRHYSRSNLNIIGESFKTDSNTYTEIDNVLVYLCIRP